MSTRAERDRRVKPAMTMGKALPSSDANKCKRLQARVAYHRCRTTVIPLTESAYVAVNPPPLRNDNV